MRNAEWKTGCGAECPMANAQWPTKAQGPMAKSCGADRNRAATPDQPPRAESANRGAAVLSRSGRHRAPPARRNGWFSVCIVAIRRWPRRRNLTWRRFQNLAVVAASRQSAALCGAELENGGALLRNRSQKSLMSRSLLWCRWNEYVLPISWFLPRVGRSKSGWALPRRRHARKISRTVETIPGRPSRALCALGVSAVLLIGSRGRPRKREGRREKPRGEPCPIRLRPVLVLAAPERAKRRRATLVAQSCTLLCRRISFCRMPPKSERSADSKSAIRQNAILRYTFGGRKRVNDPGRSKSGGILQNAILRYGRMQICATPSAVGNG
jgi:hypothetical protein